ncbi:MAG: hypothetical protein HY011_31415 [Acidobacteria bacterium]|nr:hypothetical protein [Acidobacteriota bacterium]
MNEQENLSAFDHLERIEAWIYDALYMRGRNTGAPPPPPVNNTTTERAHRQGTGSSSGQTPARAHQ